MIPCFQNVRPFALAILLLATLVSTGLPQTTELEFRFVDGNVITADMEVDSLAWKTIRRDGTVAEATIPWNAVTKLSLSNSPAFEQTERIGLLLAGLQDNNYLQRQAAEEQLSSPEIGSSFREMIQSFRDTTDSLEAKIRIDRILSRLKASEKQESVQFDELSFDGKMLQGDAGNFEVTVKYRGQPRKLLRSQLTQIVAKDKVRQRNVAFDGRAKVDLFYKPGDEFYQDDQIIVDFSQDTRGNSLEKLDPVERVFVPWGMKISSELEEGKVVVSSYSFNAFGKLPKNNSIAVYERTKRFKGIVNVDFCLPNIPTIPAGVTEFGMFIARVDKGRDFVMEGFDASGNLVVSVEAPPDPCGFMGFQCSVPVTRLRILSNPYLTRVDLEPDTDFGLDHFCFSPPVAVRFPKTVQETARLANGDILRGKKLTIGEQGLVIENSFFGSISVKLDELREYRRTVKPSSDKINWLAMLKDGSRLAIKPGRTLRSSTLDAPIPMDDIAAISHREANLRYPLKDDFRRAKNVLVFPTCRIPVNQLRLTDDGIAWEKDASKLLQPVDKSSPLGVPGKDPTPEGNSVAFLGEDNKMLPTAWFAEPVAIANQMGVVSTSNGEEWVFGPGCTFQLKGMDSNMVNLKAYGKEIQIPLDRVAGIRWAE